MAAERAPPAAGAERRATPVAYRPQLRVSEMGRVVAIGDGIVWVEGLPSAAMDEILRFGDGSEALVFHLGSRRIGAILLSQKDGLVAGASAHLTGRRLDIGVGDDFLGRVVDPLVARSTAGPHPGRTAGAPWRRHHRRSSRAISSPARC